MNNSVDAKKMNETKKILSELIEIYQSLKHFPGKHNQEDHAWNAGMGQNKKKKKRVREAYKPIPSRRNKFFRQNINSSKNSSGIISPFEAVKYGASQSRILGATNPARLMKAISTSSQALRTWSDQFKAALTTPSSGDQKKISKDFKKLSKQIASLSNSLGENTVEQNIFKTIMQSYQNTITKIMPETQKIFQENPLYDTNTPDAKMAKQVELTISKNEEK